MIEKDIDETLVLSILELATALKKKGENLTQREGITTQQWLILLMLAGDKNLPFIEKGQHKKALMASEIADVLGVSRPNITNILNALIEKKYITQFADVDDRRRKRLALTDAAVELLERLQPMRHYANSKLFSNFEKEEKEALLIYVKRCLNFLEK
jgi:DNA-binding MarR family transcriptional regulator